MNPETIKVTTVGDEVYERVRRWIVTGTLAPGAKISLRSLADNFGVSTQPVRDALRKLQAEGFVVFERRSVTVTHLSKDQVTQIFQIRLRLEHLAAEWAIGQVDADDIADLDQILGQMDRPDIGVEDWRRLNQDFHRRFYDCARSPHLLDLIKNTWDKIEPYMAIYTSTVDDFAEAHAQHVEILDLIRRGELPGLLAKTTAHLDYTAQVVTRALDAHSPAPPQRQA